MRCWALSVPRHLPELPVWLRDSTSSCGHRVQRALFLLAVWGMAGIVVSGYFSLELHAHQYFLPWSVGKKWGC